MRLPIVAATLFLFFSCAALAEEALVLGGGAKEEDALKAVNDFNSADAARVKPAPGFPKILPADELPGTRPDTFVAVLGYCPDKDHARVLRMIQVITSGAYSKKLPGEHTGACPTLAPELEKRAKR